LGGWQTIDRNEREVPGPASIAEAEPENRARGQLENVSDWGGEHLREDNIPHYPMNDLRKGGPSEGPTAGAEGEKKDSDVVDAEFEMVDEDKKKN
jgi:hypothetical protein